MGKELGKILLAICPRVFYDSFKAQAISVASRLSCILLQKNAFHFCSRKASHCFPGFNKSNISSLSLIVLTNSTAVYQLKPELQLRVCRFFFPINTCALLSHLSIMDVVRGINLSLYSDWHCSSPLGSQCDGAWKAELHKQPWHRWIPAFSSADGRGDISACSLTISSSSVSVIPGAIQKNCCNKTLLHLNRHLGMTPRLFQITQPFAVKVVKVVYWILNFVFCTSGKKNLKLVCKIKLLFLAEKE